VPFLRLDGVSAVARDLAASVRAIPCVADATKARVGMRRELHAVRESLHRSGRWLDTAGYAILEEEWPSS
jgi:hypothetical protein